MAQAPYGNHMRLDDEVDETSLPGPGEPGGPEDGTAGHDKRKVIVLLVLFLVGIGVVAYQFLRTSGPSVATAKAASASPDGAAAAAPAGTAPVSDIDSVIQQLGASSGSEQKEAFTVVRVEQLVKEFDTYVQSRQVPLPDLRVNPFQVTMDERPQETTQQKDGTKAAPADDEEARKEKLRAAAAGLKVSSILVSGKTSLVVINGNVYRVGDEVEGFKVDAIEANRVALSAQETSFELKLFDDAPVPPGTRGHK
jgi:hypothetical protein